MSNNDSTNFYSKREALLILKQLKLAKNEKTVFWGASLFLKEFLKKHSIKDYNIVGIIDNNKRLWGEEVAGIQIYYRIFLRKCKCLKLVSLYQYIMLNNI